MAFHYTLAMSKIEAIQETDEFDSDEPYVLVFAADITSPEIEIDLANIEDSLAQAMAEFLPAAQTVRYGPFDDMDAGEVAHVPTAVQAGATLISRVPFWGISGDPQPINAVSDTLFMIAVMEHDAGDLGTIRAVLHKHMMASLADLWSGYLQGTTTRLKLLKELKQDMHDALSSLITFGVDVEIIFPGVGIFPNADDLVGVTWLNLESGDLVRARHLGVDDSLSIVVQGDGGQYRVRFELKAFDVEDGEGTASAALSIAPALVPGPAVLSRELGTLDVFGRGTNRHFYLSSWNGKQWSTWSPVGDGTFLSGPSAAIKFNKKGVPNQIVLAGLGDDRRIYHARWNGSAWGNWGPIQDSKFISRPALVGGGLPTIFAVREDRHIYTSTLSGNDWTSWQQVGIGTFLSAPAAVRWSHKGDIRLDLFALGDDRTLYHSFQQGKDWSGWSKISDHQYRSAPAAVSWGPDRLDIFIIGDDRRMYQSTLKSDGWHHWAETIGQAATFRSAPAALSAEPNRLDIFAVGDDSRIYHNSWLGDQWSGWLADTPAGIFS